MEKFYLTWRDEKKGKLKSHKTCRMPFIAHSLFNNIAIAAVVHELCNIL